MPTHQNVLKFQAPQPNQFRSYALVGAAVTAALVGVALLNRRAAKKAERDNPPSGQFVDVDGVRLHYIERGTGAPLVLLHGNGSMSQDFVSSGLVDLAAKNHRVIVFDRPGFGYSERPRNVLWTPSAQAELIHHALQQLGVQRAIVLGHSWGASVAVALAEKFQPMVAGLVLVAGYYYPTARADVMLMSGPAVPVVGDILRYTVSPIAGRLMWPMVLRKLFGPAQVPGKFAGFPKEMALRPSQIRAGAAEAALMIPAAFANSKNYKAKLTMPVAIVAGDDDRLIDVDEQSARLHAELTQSSLRRVRGSGHMVHQTATDDVMSAITEAEGQSQSHIYPADRSRPAAFVGQR